MDAILNHPSLNYFRLIILVLLAVNVYVFQGKREMLVLQESLVHQVQLDQEGLKERMGCLD